MSQDKVNILCVCTGNICRSPAAEYILREQLMKTANHADIIVSSAGTHGYHVGEPADERTIREGNVRGYNIHNHTAQKVTATDMGKYDLILAMDQGHLRALQHMATQEQTRNIYRILDYANHPGENLDVADPYYGSHHDFESMFDLLEATIPAVITRLISSQSHLIKRGEK